MDFSNIDFAVNNNIFQNSNKKHVKFDLKQNVSFIYNKNDYVYNCKIYTKNIIWFIHIRQHIHLYKIKF